MQYTTISTGTLTFYVKGQFIGLTSYGNGSDCLGFKDYFASQEVAVAALSQSWLVLCYAKLV